MNFLRNSLSFLISISIDFLNSSYRVMMSFFFANIFRDFLILSTLFLFLSTQKPHLKPITITLFIILFIFQYQTTNRTNFLHQTALEKDRQQQLLNYYPPLKIPLAWWLEGRPEARIFYRLKQNLFSVFDQNIYFFAYHPREDNSFDIYPKFTFLLLPFFVLGLLRLIRNKQKSLLLTSAILPLALLTLLGNKNPLGSFSLFPFIIICLHQGILK